MDDRVRDHAAVLVDWSARIEAGDNVVVNVAEGAHELGVAVAEKLGERGARRATMYDSDEMSRAYLRTHDGDFDGSPEHLLGLYENADAVLNLGGTRNTSATVDVPAEKRQASATASKELREVVLDTDWISTIHPTRALAQQAGMSYEGYQDFVYDAVLRDWEALAEEMARVKEILDEGSEVRIETEGTDLSMSIEKRTAVNSAASVAYDSHNLPSGEVFTAPDGTEGTVTFDVPMTIRGRRVRDARLDFENGEVVDWETTAGEGALREVIETDDGARRLGELGIGMNRGISRPTDNILFDEKMARAVHLALGRAYDACLPEDETGTDSAVHVDLITDMRGDSELVVDGETIQRDGIFEWESEGET